MPENHKANMDEMKQDAALRLEHETATQRAHGSASTLADATRRREAIEARRRGEAEEVARAEAQERDAEEQDEAREKEYEDALAAESEARKQAEADADEADRLAEKVAAQEIPAHESALADRERTLGHDHPETVAARARLDAAREAAGQRKNQHRKAEPETKPAP
jgi:hypothetical protein